VIVNGIQKSDTVAIMIWDMNTDVGVLRVVIHEIAISFVTQKVIAMVGEEVEKIVGTKRV